MGQVVNTGFICSNLLHEGFGSTGVTLKKQEVADGECPSVITHLFVQTHVWCQRDLKQSRWQDFGHLSALCLTENITFPKLNILPV